MRPRIVIPSSRRVPHVTDIPLNRFFFAHGPSVYIFYLFCAFLYAHFQQKPKPKSALEGEGLKKKQTSFLTALVKNAKKPKRTEAKERIEKRTSKKHIRKKLTTSKWQRSVHKFLKCPQQANVKPKYHQKKN